MWPFVLFILVPALELTLLFEVGGRVGGLTTLLLIVATGTAGVVLARGEGLAVLERIRGALEAGRAPAVELVDGALILAAAALLLTPGFLTDAVGLLVLFPLTRPFFRGLAVTWLRDKIRVHRVDPPDFDE